MRKTLRFETKLVTLRNPDGPLFGPSGTESGKMETRPYVKNDPRRSPFFPPHRRDLGAHARTRAKAARARARKPPPPRWARSIASPSRFFSRRLAFPNSHHLPVLFRVASPSLFSVASPSPIPVASLTPFPRRLPATSPPPLSRRLPRRQPVPSPSPP
ncbi:unnamed protein product, partial [Closterium sp. NIES-65]